VQHDRLTANPSKVKTVHDLASLTDAAYQASCTVKSMSAAFAEPSILPFSRLSFIEEDFEPSSVTPPKKNFLNKRSLFFLLASL